MKPFDNKIIIITGGINGIGKATTDVFLEKGGTVIALDIDADLGKKVMDDDQTGRLEFLQVNVTVRQEVESAVAGIINRYKKIDVLINNAGITRDSTLLKMTEKDWQQVIDVNLTGVFNCTQVVAAHMAEAGSGVILNAASVVGIYGNFGQTNYVATKSGVIGMSKVWARELGRKGIRVNAVAPGFIATDMVNTIPEKVIANLESKTPLGRLGKPEDIANTYAFLASDDAAFITGTTISVDGGLVL
ncbi:3-oxoacyl-ACP reductase FabG [Robertkochia aurantiaca]|uniref:3-oxoacyl-ACP reductase FabG n=1 Tax=Robertkochia aurantiaca TaxID=2873700 RepID=UPI001CC8FFEF|nr:3-oxoacyl-ACP reductase FabG [Robertkochia sp. 3YJGBD-33]